MWSARFACFRNIPKQLHFQLSLLFSKHIIHSIWLCCSHKILRRQISPLNNQKPKMASAAANTSNTNRILVVGATGYLGSRFALASADQGHQTFALIRSHNLVPDSPKHALIQRFRGRGIHIIQGDLEDEEILLEVVRKVDIIISAVGVHETMKQLNLINAIKKSGAQIKRFLPSEFGNEYGRLKLLPLFQETADKKNEIRRILQKEGIPFTVFSANSCMGYFLYNLINPQENPSEVLIFGDGTVKACFNSEEDIAAMAVKLATDDRSLNKVIVYRPACNVMTQEDFVKFYERKTSKSLARKHIDEAQLLELIQFEGDVSERAKLSVAHSIFIKGDQTNFTVEDDEEATRLFPEYSVTTVDEYLQRCVLDRCDEIAHNTWKKSAGSCVSKP